MPAFETMDRHQKVLLWEWLGADATNEPVFDTPVEVKARWVAKSNTVTNAQGQPTNAIVEVVIDREVTLGSIMWLAPDQSMRSKSAIDQWYDDSGSAGHTEQLLEVAATAVTTDIKNRFTRYTLSLAIYKNAAT